MTMTIRKFTMNRNAIASVLHRLRIALLVSVIGIIHPGFGQSAPPTRDPNTSGYVTAKELPDRAVPPAGVDGNFIIGPSHPVPPEMPDQSGVPKGAVIEFTMNSADSKIFPGIARDANTFGVVDPADAARLIVTTSHPAPY